MESTIPIHMQIFFDLELQFACYAKLLGIYSLRDGFITKCGCRSFGDFSALPRNRCCRRASIFTCQNTRCT